MRRLYPIAGYRRTDVILCDPSWATDRYGSLDTRRRRMGKVSDAVAAAREAALTDAQRVARSHGHELTPDEADYYVHCSLAYLETLVLMDRDAWPGWAERESRQDHRQYRQEVKGEIHTFTGRMARTVARRRVERGPLPYCPF